MHHVGHLPRIVCVCSLSYPACNAHASYYTVTCSISGSNVFFSHYFINGMIFGKKLIDKEMCRIISSTNFNAQFNNICMSHYYPRHVSGLGVPILRRNNCTNTASGILALLSGCTLHRLRALLSTGVVYSRLGERG